MDRVCIFDLDGTLTDTLDSLTYCVNATLHELGLSDITAQQCESFVGNGARVLIEKSLEAVGDVQLSLIDRAMEVYGRIFQENCTYQVSLYEGIYEMIQTLRRWEVPLAVLTNKPHMQALSVVWNFFGEDVFFDIQGQRDGVPRKPDPTGAWKIADQLQMPYDKCIYVGDSEVDMQTGKAAGMQTIGVTWGFRNREILEEYGADYIIDRPQDLLAIVEGKE